MRYRVALTNGGTGRVIASCGDLPGCRVEAGSRDAALEAIRRAIAYYREMCPCDVTADAGVEIEVSEERARA